MHEAVEPGSFVEKIKDAAQKRSAEEKENKGKMLRKRESVPENALGGDGNPKQ